MKTEQLMVRDLGFIQRISDGYFNATKLIEFYNKQYNEKKQLGNYMNTNSTSEFIEQLKKEGIENPIITKKGGKGDSVGTWVHPKVFIDLAMWVSVEFKSKVIDYVIDGLIKTRHDAGDYYNEMTAAILESYVNWYGHKPSPLIYIQEAERIKSLVAIKDRNSMTEAELRQITYLQRFNTMLIKKGLGKDARIKRLIEASEVVF